MSPQEFRAKVLRFRHLTLDVREMTLELVDPPLFHFLPGQSIAISFPGQAFSQSHVRYFSLASSPSSPRQVVLLFNAGEQRKGATFLSEHSVGEELVFSGPLGNFHVHQDPGRDFMFIGTGTGIAPLWSMIGSLLEQSCSQPILLVWGLRSESDIYYYEEIQQLADRHSNFSFILTLSQPGHTWKGKRGRVTHLLKDFHSMDRVAVYVCGNRKMVVEVTGLLHQKGVRTIYRERHHEDS